MRCSDCGHENVPGSLFCERCGNDLEEPATAPEPDVEAVVAPADGRACPACQHHNDARFAFCEACGARLPAAAGDQPVRQPEPEPEPEPVLAGEPAARRIEPEPGPQPEPAELPPPDYERSGQLVTGPQRGKVKLVVEQGLVVGKQFVLNQAEMLVGREDPSEEVYPDVDLSGLDEGYVHRQHARLSFEGSFLFVTHLGGHNKTYVNNRPIADGLAHPLNIGDTLRLGKVLLRLVEA